MRLIALALIACGLIAGCGSGDSTEEVGSSRLPYTFDKPSGFRLVEVVDAPYVEGTIEESGLAQIESGEYADGQGVLIQVVPSKQLNETGKAVYKRPLQLPGVAKTTRTVNGYRVTEADTKLRRLARISVGGDDYLVSCTSLGGESFKATRDEACREVVDSFRLKT